MPHLPVGNGTEARAIAETWGFDRKERFYAAARVNFDRFAVGSVITFAAICLTCMPAISMPIAAAYWMIGLTMAYMAPRMLNTIWNVTTGNSKSDLSVVHQAMTTRDPRHPRGLSLQGLFGWIPK